MKHLLTAACLLISLAAAAQQVIDVNKTDDRPAQAFITVNGMVFSNVKYVRLTGGSPYFREEWMSAVIVSDRGVTYRPVPARLDLLAGDLIFKGANDQEFVCVSPIREIRMTDTVSGAGYRFVHSSSDPALAAAEKGWYQPLVAGKAALYLFTDKGMQEYKPYNSGVVEQRVVTNDFFLLWHNGKLSKVRKARELILLLPDKKAELEALLAGAAVKDRPLAGQLTALVTHYNTLQ